MIQKTYYTYVVICNDGTYYTGSTTNLTKRLKQHNGHISGGAKYTRGRRPIILHYWEKHETLQKAMQREYEIKKLKHHEKVILQ